MNLLFAVMAVSFLASGVLVTTQGWSLLGSLLPLLLIAVSLRWLARLRGAGARLASSAS